MCVCVCVCVEHAGIAVKVKMAVMGFGEDRAYMLLVDGPRVVKLRRPKTFPRVSSIAR